MPPPVNPNSLDWITARPFVCSLLILMVADIVMGLLCGWVAKTLSSSVSRKGMSQKAGTLLLVAVAAVVDPYMPGIAVVKCVALFYIVTEALSITENAGKLGIPLPAPLIDALQKLRGAKAPSAPSPIAPPEP